MGNEKNLEYYISKILKDIEFCINVLKDVNEDRFNQDEVLSSAISFKFVQISENVKKLPVYVFEKYPSIPWSKISGLRNRIVHDYGSVQLEIIYNTVKEDLPLLREELSNLVHAN